MTYEYKLYPSSDKELLACKEEVGRGKIKAIRDNSLRSLYRKNFSKAVKTYNEFTVSGKLIDDYYESLINSNVPIVYELIVSVVFEMISKEEMAKAEKYLRDYEKELSKKPATYITLSAIKKDMETIALHVFFFGTADGYPTGMMVRSDFIDYIKQTMNDGNELPLKESIALFIEKESELFEKISNNEIKSFKAISEEQINTAKKNPYLTHHIEVDSLKEKMNTFQRLTTENERMLNLAMLEKERLIKDIEWVKATTITIQQAEADRLAELKREAEERRLDEERREREEAEENARLAIEATKRRAEKDALLAELLAKRGKEQMEQRKTESIDRMPLSAAELTTQIQNHLDWMKRFSIKKTLNFKDIGYEAITDENRLHLLNRTITGCKIREEGLSLVGAIFQNCTFVNCDFGISLFASTIDNCTFVDCKVSGIDINNCNINNSELTKMDVLDCILDKTTILNCDCKGIKSEDVTFYPETSFVNSDFSLAIFRNTDMKKNVFVRCNLERALMRTCDLRRTFFQRCNTDGMEIDDCVKKGYTVA